MFRLLIFLKVIKIFADIHGHQQENKILMTERALCYKQRRILLNALREARPVRRDASEHARDSTPLSSLAGTKKKKNNNHSQVLLRWVSLKLASSECFLCPGHIKSPISSHPSIYFIDEPN